MAGNRLLYQEREEIAVLHAGGCSAREIGRRLGRAHTTVSRELKRTDSFGNYRAHIADRKAERLARRPKSSLLDTVPELFTWIGAKLRDKLSPMTISKTMPAHLPQVSHETIYNYVYRGRFGDPRTVLFRPRKWRTASTRTGRDNKPLGHIKLIDQRPDTFGSEPGHWEGDLLVGKRNRTVAAVLTEVHTRRVKIVALPTGRKAIPLAHALTEFFNTLPTDLAKTLTWDQGREMSAWQQLETATGLDVYFCHAGCPWEKGLVENVCGLLRRWLPKNKPIPTHQHTLDRYQTLLNTMPRRSLHWNTAQHAFDTLTGATAA